MISAVVMAGYNNRWEVRRYAKVVAEHYGEQFIETGYRPLREFKTIENGKEIQKPLIQYSLEKLFESKLISEIVIVGHQMLLEQRLGKFIEQFQKPCTILNQNTKISEDVVQRFNIIHRKVKYNSVAGNIIKGYAATAAAKDKKHAIFVAADSPLTSKEFIENFVHLVAKHKETDALIFPAILIRGKKDKLGRHPLKLVNDTEYQFPVSTDSAGRQGFRLSSLMAANPFLFDVNTTNTAYRIRKLLNPNAQLRLFRITRNLGYPNVYSKYFIRKNLSIKEIENITSVYFNGRLKLIPMLGEEATYDYDGTDLEFRELTKMLNSTKKAFKKN
jgi:CTP:molybdopterin cytidylyltransferase MocA